ncbi:IS30 family transposase [uncultured Ruegeria sp.]|uniref:IS30 family transposase n=1 Tax=uncultured Ruegeria sp. TaxID=259304 RepID=UPI00345BEC5E
MRIDAPRQRKLIRHPELRKRVVERLKNGWTPEQIGNRMIYEGARLRVCQETIYRYINSREGMADELWWYLPEHRMYRRPRRARKRLPPKFDRDVSILFRPDDVAHRRQFGHWEGDLMLFKQSLGQSNVTSLVERVSRFTVLLKNPNKRTKPVMGKIMKAVRDLPYLARKSITFDDGTEFVSCAASCAWPGSMWVTNLRPATRAVLISREFRPLQGRCWSCCQCTCLLLLRTHHCCPVF